ncbi:MAG TPA: SulP family inorganic anion transporter, partial [Coleofasciculaceae cyanobacterium]
MSRAQSRFQYLGGDLVGGITAAIIALPLALAFGVASGLGATAGLYGAVACGIFAALFGGTPGQVSGPTGPMTVVTAGMIMNHHDHPDLIFASIILAGLIQILLGVFRLGKLIEYIPYPVISGFMTGIGVIIIALQIPPLFGLSGAGNVLEALEIFPRIPALLNPVATVIGLGTLATILILKKISPRLPSALIALALSTLAVVLLRPDIPLIGAIPAGLPIPHLPTIHLPELRLITEAAIALALLGSLDSLLTSVVVDKITGNRHDSNKELLGQGVGNMVSGLIGGLPGAGATMRSVVNIHAGGRTNLSGVIHGLLLLAVLLGLGALTANIPLACLAGILIHVGITIIDYRGLKGIRRSPRSDTAVMLVVLGLTVFVDLIIAVIAGIALASVLFVKNLSDVEPSTHHDLPEDELPHGLPKELSREIYRYRFKGPLYFGEARNFSAVMDKLKGIRYLILDFEHVPMIDQTGAFALEDAIERAQRQGVKVFLLHPFPHIQAQL